LLSAMADHSAMTRCGGQTRAEKPRKRAKPASGNNRAIRAHLARIIHDGSSRNR
jgi:hypothetical protein